MKWQLLIISLLLCVASVGAWEETFQGGTAFSYSQTGTSGGAGSAPLSASLIQPTTNENWYFNINQYTTDEYGTGTGLTLINPTPPTTPSDYFAFTNVGWSKIPSASATTSIRFYDSTGNYLTQSSDLTSLFANNIGKRFELKRDASSGAIHLYINSVDEGLIATTTIRPAVFGFYDTIGGGYYTPNNFNFAIDDIIQQTGSSSNIVGTIPKSWYIKKDMLGATVNGLYNNLNASVRTTYFTSTYGSGTNLNTNLELVDSNGRVWETAPITGYAGSAQLNLTDFTASSAPFGLYRVRIGGTATYDTLWYIGTGASISWDKSQYPNGDTATITYDISSSYYDTITYNYKIVVMDIYGATIGTNSTITTQTGSVTKVLDSTTYPTGVYYAELIATPKAGGNDIIMNYAQTEIVGYVFLSGYVMNAETGALLSGVNINTTQGTSTKTSTSLTGGLWNSSNNWLSGTPITINTTKTGYAQDLLSITALSAKSISLNISLVPLPATSTGVSIGGIVRDNVYSNPIPGASVVVRNTTSGEYQTKTTNIAGFYRADNLYSGRLYDVWSSKTGYGNSTVAQKLAVGA